MDNGESRLWAVFRARFVSYRSSPVGLHSERIYTAQQQEGKPFSKPEPAVVGPMIVIKNHIDSKSQPTLRQLQLAPVNKKPPRHGE